MNENEIDVRQLLFSLCEDEAVWEEDIDLQDSGLLDSLMLIELLDALEDRGIALSLTRIDRTHLRTVKGIERLIEENRSQQTPAHT